MKLGIHMTTNNEIIMAAVQAALRFLADIRASSALN